ncbi:MAG: gliding motility protein GldC [Bacteroidota bacterium]
MSEITKTSTINIQVSLDEERMPIEIKWKAEESPTGKEQACKAMLLSLFDEETKDTFKIDLWTKEMQVIEMDRFFYQTLKALGDTYFRATQNKPLANDMQRFAQYFGESTEIIPKQ